MRSYKNKKGNIPGNSKHRNHRGEIFGIVYNIVAISIAIYVSLATYSHTILYLTVGYPLIGVLMLMLGIGEIKFIILSKSKPLSSIVLGFLVLCGVSYLIVARRFDLLTYQQFWLPFICVSVTMYLFLTSTAIDKAMFVRFQTVLVIIISAAYAAGTVIQTNCALDDSPPLKFNTSVQEKYTSKHKSSTYYHLKLTPWQRHQDPIEIDVTRTEYEQTPVDGPVGGHVKRGLLGIKWFYLDM